MTITGHNMYGYLHDDSDHHPNLTTCWSCQIDAKRQAGAEMTNEERNHWTMWGCTCSPEAAAEAMAWMNLVTR